tara:strand:- start:284 stop:487 length:204 start_codon:yes stop_codon:yes gene_type:complete
MWKAAKMNHKIWFVAIAIFNTVGILPILYIYVFSKWAARMKESNPKPAVKKTSKKKIVLKKKKTKKK